MSSVCGSIAEPTRRVGGQCRSGWGVMDGCVVLVSAGLAPARPAGRSGTRAGACISRSVRGGHVQLLVQLFDSDKKLYNLDTDNFMHNFLCIFLIP